MFDGLSLVALMAISLFLISGIGATMMLLASCGALKFNAKNVYQTSTWGVCLVVLMFPLLLRIVPESSLMFSVSWFESLGINITIFFDNLSYLLILFSSFIFLLFSILTLEKKPSYYFSMLLVQISLNGVLLSYNLLLFYFFYELMLLPLFYLMFVYGSSDARRAVYKFLIYTLAGSLCMLIAIIYCGLQYQEQFGQISFDVNKLLQLSLSPKEQAYLFLGFFIAFAVKSPIFPFHTWLPATYSSAPPGVTVIIASLLFQAGVYGLFRFATILFPDAYYEYAGVMAVLAVIGIVYAALLAWTQNSIKKLLAYASISHVGFSILGLSVLSVMGMVGGLFQIISHILIAAGLFALVAFLHRRNPSDQISDFSGLASVAPRFSFFMLCFSLAAISLPLSIGFVGEFIILQASFVKYKILTIFAVLGVILGAVYMLNLCQKILFGKSINNDFLDLDRDETTILTSLLMLILILGIYPKVLLGLIEPVGSSHLQIMTNKRQQINERPKQRKKRPKGIVLASGVYGN